ncbi:MAG: fimbrillin family protein [Tidjanibacter sp.]|nr:fimbrillin family protein [Tidjanibacter sp.]
MKRLLTIVTLAATLFSCDNLVPDAPITEGDKAIAITATLSNYSETKATDTAFEQGDQIGLFVLTPEVYLNNGKFTMTDGEMKPETEYKWYDDAEKSAALVGYYPYDAEFKIAESAGFTVNADQSTHALYTASDLMLAATTATPTDAKVTLPFKHVLSKMVITIDNKTTDELTGVFVGGLCGKVSFNPTTGENIVVEGEAGTIKAASVTDKSGAAKWVLITVPQTASPTLIVTTEKQQYSYTLDEEITMKSGCQYSAAITINAESISTDFTAEITDWTSDKELNFNQQKAWTIIGEIGAENAKYWQVDYAMVPTEEGVWRGTVPMYENAKFKIRCSPKWDDTHNRGGVQTTVGEPFAVKAGGNDIVNIGRSAQYEIIYDPKAETITTLVDGPERWAVVGSFGEPKWESDIAMTYADSAWSATVTFDADQTEFKLRGEGGWDYNRGLDSFNGVPQTIALGRALPLGSGGDNMRVEKAGTYTITYNPVAETIVVNASNVAENWKAIGTATYLDDVTTTFGLSPTEYEVEIEESTTTAGRYRLVNPYGKIWPHYGKDFTHTDGEIIINATNPDKVYIEPSSIGVKHADYGDLTIMSLVEENGMTTVAYGRLLDGVISFYAGALGMEASSKLYQSNVHGLCTIALPGHTRTKSWFGFDTLDYLQAETLGDGTKIARLSLDSRFDNPYIKYVVLEGVLYSNEIGAKVSEMIAGTLGSTTLDQSGFGTFEIECPLSKSGVYTAIVYTIDPAGNPYWWYRQFGYTVDGETVPENDTAVSKFVTLDIAPDMAVKFNMKCSDALTIMVSVTKTADLANYTKEQYADYVLANGCRYNNPRSLVSGADGYDFVTYGLEPSTQYTLIAYTKTLYEKEALFTGTVTTEAAPSWKLLEGKGTYNDRTRFFSSDTLKYSAAVDIYQVAGKERYRVVKPYESFWNVMQKYIADSYIGASAESLEFYVENDKVHFLPCHTGYLELNVGNNCELIVTENPAAGHANVPWNNTRNCRKSEGVYQLAPAYIISNSNCLYGYYNSDNVVIITLPGYSYDFPAAAAAPARVGRTDNAPGLTRQ